MKLKKLRITRAKRTAMGRFVCRLLGDECGAVAMEYVVIGVLIVAAAVGAAVYFGKMLTSNFTAMGDTISGPGDGQTIQEHQNTIQSNIQSDKTNNRGLAQGVNQKMAGKDGAGSSAPEIE